MNASSSTDVPNTVVPISLGIPSAPPPTVAPRRKSRKLQVGSVAVGGDAPVSVQSMTTTLTSDVNATLQQIAELTGGQAFFPTSTKALDRIYEKVAAQIRAQYSLGFTPTNDKKDGTWRRLEVRLSRSAPDGFGSYGNS